MKLVSLHMGEVLRIGDAVVMLAERRTSGGHHARLAIEFPDGTRFELTKKNGTTVGNAPVATNKTGAHDAPQPVFARR